MDWAVILARCSCQKRSEWYKYLSAFISNRITLELAPRHLCCLVMRLQLDVFSNEIPFIFCSILPDCTVLKAVVLPTGLTSKVFLGSHPSSRCLEYAWQPCRSLSLRISQARAKESNVEDSTKSKPRRRILNQLDVLQPDMTNCGEK